MWWSTLRWHHLCLEMQIAIVTSPWGWLPLALCTQPYSHSTSLLNQEEPALFLSATPSLLSNSSLFPVSPSFFYTSNSFSISKPLRYDYSYGNEAGWSWQGCHGVMGSVSGWWLRSPAASLPRAGNSNLIRAKTPPSSFCPESGTRGWGQNRNRMRETKVKSLGNIPHAPSLCFPRMEPEVFSHEWWVHFRAFGETFLFHSERGH